jgi:biopolymer transport protein ExbB/TolQ
LEQTASGASAVHLHIADLMHNADPIVQGVMLVLGVASIICWAIILEKVIRLWRFAGRLQPRIRFLATVGSTAPFVGLFGTVWGIMNSFSAIAQQKDTSLVVVAPGIAEALFATALGLVAAIPAVVAYNQISGSVSRSSERINLAIAALANTLVQQAAVSQSEV